MTTENQDLLVETRGAVRVLTMNRPQTKNGLTIELCDALIKALQAANSDGAVRVVLLTGQGDAFCSGLDLKAAMALAQQQGQAGDGNVAQSNEERMRTYFHGLIRAVRAVDKPVVALISGPAVGFGCDLALACDLRLGTAQASFGEVFVKRGLMPDGGSTFTLPRLIGVGKALELMFLGDMVNAEESLRLGMLNRVLATRDEAWPFVERLAAAAPLCLREIKHAVYAGLGGTLDSALEAEVVGQMRLLRSADFVEGFMAFLSKRPPNFTGA